MSDKKKIAIALSGGVDSSVSALLLKQQGWDVTAFTAKLTEGDCSTVVENAKKVADKLEIPFYFVDLHDYFKENIIAYFENSYRTGKTPNPCIWCNKLVKWGKLFDFAKENGAEYIATGHYADIKTVDGIKLLYPAKDPKKDQLYFLFNLPKEMLEKTVFPLSSFTSKEEIRKIAAENDLPSKSAKDSQDVCFIQNMSSTQYINNVINHEKGDFILVSTGEKIGKHDGAAKFTAGQRKGIGIAYKEPLYVVSTDVVKNIVYVGVKQDTFTNDIKLTDLNIHDTRVSDEFEALVKIRYNMPAKPAKVKIDGISAVITFDEDVSGVAKGQAGVFYDKNDGHLIGGGFIV